VYFAGDTGFGPHFAAIRDRFGPLRLAILPIGAFRPQWFMRYAHTSPGEAVEAHLLLGARQSLGIHHGTFPLADDGQDEPVQELERSLERRSLPREVFWTPPFGEGRWVPSLPPGGGARDGAREPSDQRNSNSA
jgi:L-ascorbate metabolism protein UlaG (beta-lactamase superfamily)